MRTYKKMTRETMEVCSDKKKPREEIENIKETRPRTTVRNSDVQVCIVWEYNI